MNGKRSASRSWVFFLVDRTGAMGQRVRLLEEELNSRFQSLEASPAGARAIPVVIAIESVSAFLVPRQPSGSFRLQDTSARCDFGKALDVVENTLQQGGFRAGQQVHIYALLNSEPAGDWRHRASRIKASGAAITALLFGDARVPRSTLEALVSSGENRALGPVALHRSEIQRVLDWVFHTLEAVLPVPPEPSPPSEPLSAQPVQPATPLPISPSQPPDRPTGEPLIPPIDDTPPDPGLAPETPTPASSPPAPIPPQKSMPIRIIGQEKETDEDIGEPAEAEPPLAPDAETLEPQDSQTAPIAADRHPDQGPASPVQSNIVLNIPESGEVPEPAPMDDIAEESDLDGDAAFDDTDLPPDLSDRALAEPSLETTLPPSPPESDVSDESIEAADPIESSAPIGILEQAPDETDPDNEPGTPEVADLDIPPMTVKPPPVDSEGVATNWLDLKPDEELGDRVNDTETDLQDGLDDWKMLGASRRGKMHAHKGIFREDAFKMGKAAGWHLMVVADGGGSYKLSRVGSHLAAETAVNTMARVVSDLDQTGFSNKEICEVALQKGLREAWEALENEAFEREIDFKDLGTTFLALMHRPDDEEHLVGVAQVGDGLVAARLDVPPTGKLVSLAEPDVGETASVTLFLTSKHWKEWFDRVAVYTLEAPLLLLAAMCDGVADDFIPFEQHLDMLFDKVDLVTRQADPEEALLDFLAYEKRGSFDDRTLTLIYQPRPNLEKTEEPATEKTKKPEQKLDQDDGTEEAVVEEAAASEPLAQPPGVEEVTPEPQPDARAGLQALVSAAEHTKNGEAQPALFTPGSDSEEESSEPLPPEQDSGP